MKATSPSAEKCVCVSGSPKSLVSAWLGLGVRGRVRVRVRVGVSAWWQG